MKLRALTEKDEGVTITLDVAYEDLTEPEFQNDDGTLDTALNTKILRDAERNVWAWCHVTVKARWNGWTGRDHLGGCSYRDEAEFRADGYYQDMVGRALDDLNDSLARAAAQLATLQETAA